MNPDPTPPHIHNHHITLKKKEKKWGGGVGHIINQSIDPRGNNNPTLNIKTIIFI